MNITIDKTVVTIGTTAFQSASGLTVIERVAGGKCWTNGQAPIEAGSGTEVTVVYAVGASSSTIRFGAKAIAYEAFNEWCFLDDRIDGF